MIRLILVLLSAAFMMHLSQEQMLRNSSSLKMACAQEQSATLSSNVASAEKPVSTLHSLEGSAFLVLLGCSAVLICKFHPLLYQFVSTAWVLVIVGIILLSGFALLFEGAADGLQQQFGYHAKMMDSLGICCGYELLSIVALIGALIIGPPRGWSGDEELELL